MVGILNVLKHRRFQADKPICPALSIKAYTRKNGFIESKKPWQQQPQVPRILACNWIYFNRPKIVDTLPHSFLIRGAVLDSKYVSADLSI